MVSNLLYHFSLPFLKFKEKFKALVLYHIPYRTENHHPVLCRNSYRYCRTEPSRVFPKILVRRLFRKQTPDPSLKKILVLVHERFPRTNPTLMRNLIQRMALNQARSQVPVTVLTPMQRSSRRKNLIQVRSQHPAMNFLSVEEPALGTQSSQNQDLNSLLVQ